MLNSFICSDYHTYNFPYIPYINYSTFFMLNSLICFRLSVADSSDFKKVMNKMNTPIFLIN